MQAQFFDKSINKDSLLQSIIKDLPVEKRDELLEQYNGGSAEAKDFFLFMFSMPRSSKQALIRNIDSNYDKIAYLKREYAKFVPKNYIVSVGLRSFAGEPSLAPTHS
jgi:hypothetical protein